MSTTTGNLNLNKINTAQDGGLTLNLDTFLGDNWDKIDAAVGKLANLNTQQKSNLVAAINELLSEIQSIDLSGLADKNFSNINLLNALSNLGFTGKALTANGYYKLPSGLIIQWGYISTTLALVAQIINFPITFPNSCLNIITQCQFNTGNDSFSSGYNNISAITNSSFTVDYRASRYWFAIGN